MKKRTLLLLSTFLIMNIIHGQTRMSKEEKLKKHIIELDIAAWNAWKNKDVNYFRANTTETFQSGNAYGFTSRDEMITTAFVDCNVKSFALYNIELVKLNKKSVMLTYTASQDAECGGERLSPNVRATVTYVRQGGKWLEAFYMEASIEE